MSEQNNTIDRDLLDAVTFAGGALGPLFLNDPASDTARDLLAAYAALDPAAAAAEWPFGAPDELERAFALMVGGLAGLASRTAAVAPAGGATAGDALAGDATAGDAAPVPAPADDALEALIWEYRRLFVGPQAKAAPPWGSVYTDHDRVAFGASERELRRWMRAQGIALRASDTDPADHIGLMLEMMAWVAASKPAALPEYLRDHLLTWAPHFLERVDARTTHSFYQGLARLTAETLEGIRQSLALQVDYPRFYC